jgi:hypothetical protein
MKRALITIFITLAAISSAVFGQTTQPVKVGVFAQPPDLLQVWKERGITHYFGWASRYHTSGQNEAVDRLEQQKWRDAVEKVGGKWADLPTPDWQKFPPTVNDIKKMVDNPNCLGVIGPDEADLKLLNPATQKWDKWRVDLPTWKKFWAVVKEGDPNGRLIRFGNFAGPELTAGNGVNPPKYTPYCEDLTDIGHDWYPRNKNKARYPLYYPQWGVQLLKQASPGKRYWAFLECSWQDISTEGGNPSKDDILAEALMVKAEGVEGIIWFPQKPKPNASHVFDNTTVEQARATQMVAQLFSINPPSGGHRAGSVGDR